jgi:hypothetical protein
MFHSTLYFRSTLSFLKPSTPLAVTFSWSSAEGVSSFFVSFVSNPSSYSLPPPSYCPEVAQSWRVTNDHHDIWSSTMMEILALVNQSYQAYVITFISTDSYCRGPYHWNYADFLMTGGAGCDTFTPGSHCPGQTDTECKIKCILVRP